MNISNISSIVFYVVIPIEFLITSLIAVRSKRLTAVPIYLLLVLPLMSCSTVAAVCVVASHGAGPRECRTWSCGNS